MAKQRWARVADDTCWTSLKPASWASPSGGVKKLIKGVPPIEGPRAPAAVGTRVRSAIEGQRPDQDIVLIVLVGEIGGVDGGKGRRIRRRHDQAVVAFIAGRAAPAGKKMGHAGAIVTGNPKLRLQARSA